MKFETDDGSAVKSQSVKEGASAQVPSVPTKEGFNFAGWYADKELTKAYDFSGKVTANITLYAKWTNIATEPEKDSTI